MSTQKTLLFVHYGDDWIRGSERCLIDLVTHIDRSKFKVLVWCNSKILQQELVQHNIVCLRSRFTILFGWNKPVFDVLNFLRLLRRSLGIIDQYNVDLIHSNSGAPNQWLALASRIKNRPLLTHLHSAYLLRDRLSLGLHHNSHVVGVSRAVTAELIEDGRKPSEVSVIYNGIDVDALLAVKPHKSEICFDLQPGNKIPIRLACIGSLIHRKGVDLCIQAVAKLNSRGILCSLLIIGDGPERAQLELLSEGLGIARYVFFVGEYQNPIAILKSGIDIYVSCPRDEAFGLTFAEAGLARLPVIASNVGGIPEVVVQNTTGLIVEPNDAEAIANAITALITHPKTLLSMRENGFRRAVKKFNIATQHRQFERLYTQLIANNTKTSLSLGYLAHTFATQIKKKLLKPALKVQRPELLTRPLRCR